MTEPETAEREAPASEIPRQARWVSYAAWAGAVWVIFIFISGAVEWGRELAGLLSRQGIPGGNGEPAGGIFYLPILVSTPGLVWAVSRAAYNEATRKFAAGFVWSATLFLIDPAARILFHVAAPTYAVTDSASFARTILSVLLIGAWTYFVVSREVGQRWRAGRAGYSSESENEADRPLP